MAAAGARQPRNRRRVIGGHRVGNDVDIGRRVHGDWNIQRSEGGGGYETELGDVGTGGEVDAEFRVGAGVAVVLEEALAHVAGGDANDGIVGGIVGGGAAE